MYTKFGYLYANAQVDWYQHYSAISYNEIGTGKFSVSYATMYTVDMLTYRIFVSMRRCIHEAKKRCKAVQDRLTCCSFTRAVRMKE